MNARYFCTYFDHLYLSRGLAMFRSLKRHCPGARLWILCLSQECHDVLTQLALDGVTLIRLEDFERGDEALLAAKANRNRIEYYFTCTPSLPLFVLRNSPEVDLVTYLDSDLYFFSSPEPIFDEIADHSIAITPHHFPASEGWAETLGKFNVGWLSFRRDKNGIACLNWWREQCLAWCSDVHEPGRFADQKYLDEFPQRFENLKIIQHKGANVAAWNLKNYRLHTHGDALRVDDQPLLFYHFQGLRKIAPGVIDPCVQWYKLRVSWLMEKEVFRPYLRELRKQRRLLERLSRNVGLVHGLPRGRLDAGKTGITARWTELVSAYRGVLSRRFLLSGTS